MVPTVATSRALGLAAALAGAVRTLAAADGDVAGDSAGAGWSGDAAQSWAARGSRLRADLAGLAATAAATSVVVTDWADDATAAARAMAAARYEVESARAAQASAEAAGQWFVPRLARAEDAAWSRWAAAKERYWAACRHAQWRLTTLLAEVPQHSLGVDEQVQDAVRTAWTTGLADPARMAWSLTGSVVTDRSGWSHAWAGLPGALWRSVRHPVATVQAVVDVPAWRAGRYGEGIGALAGAAIPWGRGRALTVAHEVPLAFESAADFADFGSRLHAGLAAAGHPDAVAIVVGSSVTGRRFLTGAAFDAGRLSDVDVAVASPSLMDRAAGLGVELRSGGARTAPLSAAQVRALGLDEVTSQLSDRAGHPVKLMVYRDPEVALRRSPGVVAPR